jgi:hypothetical protein
MVRIELGRAESVSVGVGMLCGYALDARLPAITKAK